MTTKAQKVIAGRVENGAILPVEFPFYTGDAGVRMFDSGRVEFAFAGKRMTALPAAGTIDGEPYNAVSHVPGTSGRGMFVVSAWPDVPESESPAEGG